MKKREAENKIRETIRKHGFEVETDMRNALPGVKRTDAAVQQRRNFLKQPTRLEGGAELVADLQSINLSYTIEF